MNQIINIGPTDNVELLVYPYGTYEVESRDGDEIWLVDRCGMIRCSIAQVRKIKK